MLLRNRSISVTNILFGITILLWILVLVSVAGWADIFRGRIVPAVMVGVAILLPLIAVILSAFSKSNDDQAHAG